MGWSEESPVTVKLRAECQGVNHEAPGNRGSQSEGTGARKSQDAWLDHREMGTVEGGEIREGARVRQGPAHRRPLYFSLSAEKIL